MGLAPVQSPAIDTRFACFKLSIRRSKIHRFGVYAEYTGERLNRFQAKNRDRGSFTYLFAVDAYWTLDGAVGGSGAEIINHSCDPSLISRVMQGHVLYMSLRAIEPGEELTIDYNFTPSGDRTPCACGAKNCRGIMEKRR
jgi:SET domain-containing protein